MIVDSSALIAIALGEPSSPHLLEILAGADSVKISAANWLELWMVLDRRTTEADRNLVDEILLRLGVDVAPVTAGQAKIARSAWHRFGKGSGHPAHLNFGDCFAYALASDFGESLLYVGDDFGHTDIRSARLRPSEGTVE
ncbi:MAG: type II toxin-antitoxin system VapC family toxin [Thermomicrobiales bacterium]